MSHLANCNFRPRLIEMFDRPPQLGYGMPPQELVTNRNHLVNVRRKDERIHIEGRWQNIRHLVAGLIADGWNIKDELTGEPSGFKFTEVTLER